MFSIVFGLIIGKYFSAWVIHTHSLVPLTFFAVIKYDANTQYDTSFTFKPQMLEFPHTEQTQTRGKDDGTVLNWDGAQAVYRPDLYSRCWWIIQKNICTIATEQKKHSEKLRALLSHADASNRSIKIPAARRPESRYITDSFREYIFYRCCIYSGDFHAVSCRTSRGSPRALIGFQHFL